MKELRLFESLWAISCGKNLDRYLTKKLQNWV